MNSESIELKKIFQHYPNAFINAQNELILIPKTNLWINLSTTLSEEDLHCKLLEYVSRDACAALPYNSNQQNAKYQRENLKALNNVLGTHFSKEDMELIYCYLGNGINRSLCIRFVRDSYNMSILTDILKNSKSVTAQGGK